MIVLQQRYLFKIQAKKNVSSVAEHKKMCVYFKSIRINHNKPYYYY